MLTIQCPLLSGWGSIEQVTTHLVRQYLHDNPILNEPIDINRGNCENFAIEVCKRWPGAEVYGVEEFQCNGKFDWELLSNSDWGIKLPTGYTTETLEKKRLGGHLWVVFNSKHYDAEAPDGVLSFFDLPFFQRQLSK